MKKVLTIFLAAVLLLGCLPMTALAEGNFPVYRLYNPYSGEHLMSTDEKEIRNLTSNGWSVDGVAWYSVSKGETVYRLYNPYDGSHLYTMNASEIQKCLSLGWLMDGPVSYSETEEKGTPIYRLFNPYADAHYHLYTVNQEEIRQLTSLGWIKEGVAWYAAGDHGHQFGTEWKSDETHHWHECSCGEKNDNAEHTFGDWVLVDSPTENFNGLKKRYCTVCNYQERVIIPALSGHEHTWGEFVKGKSVAEHKYFTEYEYVSTCTQCDETRTMNKKEVNQAHIKQVSGEIVKKINALRKEKGLNTLWTSPEWDQWAEKRAFDLHANFSHDGAEHLIGNQKVTRENILEIGLYGVDNMGDTVDAEFFFRRFASSDGHLANMLGSPAHGIAVALNLDPKTGSITCAMTLVLDQDQWLEDENNQNHVHQFGTEWKSDETHHWQECACGEKSRYAEHTWGEWDIKSEPEKDENGWKERVCSVCGKVEGQEIPALVHQHKWSEFAKGDLVEAHKYFNTYKWESTCSECGEIRSKTIDEATSYTDTVAKEMISYVNRERSARGLNTLWVHEDWNSWAETRAKQLHHDFSHNGAEHSNGNQKVCAENITEDNLIDYGDKGDSVNGFELYRRFFESEGHLANMLTTPAHGIAVGIDYDVNTGGLTCAMVIIWDIAQEEPQTCQHVWEEESREITREEGIRIEFIQHLVCSKCGSKDVKSGTEINEEKLAGFPAETIAEVNKERVSLGLPALKIVGGEAAAYTQRRANEIAENFSHDGMGGMYDKYHNQAENIAAISTENSRNGFEFYRTFRDSTAGHHEAMINPNVTYIAVAFAHDEEYVFCAMELFYRPADQLIEANEPVK